MTLSAFGPYWYTPNAYAEGIFSLTRNQVGSRVFTPMVVHAVHRSLLGYFSRANSASFCTALVLSAIGSLAIFCSFFRHAVSVARFWLKSAWGYGSERTDVFWGAHPPDSRSSASAECDRFG